MGETFWDLLRPFLEGRCFEHALRAMRNPPQDVLLTAFKDAPAVQYITKCNSGPPDLGTSGGGQLDWAPSILIPLPITRF